MLPHQAFTCFARKYLFAVHCTGSLPAATAREPPHSHRKEHPSMTKKNYYLLVVLSIIVAFTLVCMTGGFGPLFTNPIVFIFVGFLLGLTIVYHVVKHPAR